MDLLRTAFPNGVPARDYRPLLAVLWEEYCEENLGIVLAGVPDDEPAVIINDVIKAVTWDHPPEPETERIRRHLHAAGFTIEGQP